MSVFYNLRTKLGLRNMPKVMPEYKEEVRKNIVRAALEIGEEKGLSNIRMEDVAGKIGISRATLYLYFRNREELIAEGNRAFCDDVYKMLAEALGKGNHNELLLELFDNYLFPEDGFGAKIVVEMFAETMKNERIGEIVGGSYYGMRHFISDFIRKQKENGRINEGVDPDLAAGTLQSVALGLKVGTVVGLERDEAKRIWKNAVEKIIIE